MTERTALDDRTPEDERADASGLCPVCGERITVSGETTDGRLIGTCGDAFTRKRWLEPDQPE